MCVLARVCAESEKSSSHKYGSLGSEALVDVETRVSQDEDLWITLWLECMDEHGSVNDVLGNVQRRAASQVVREHSTKIWPDVFANLLNLRHVGKQYLFIVSQTWH